MALVVLLVRGFAGHVDRGPIALASAAAIVTGQVLSTLGALCLESAGGRDNSYSAGWCGEGGLRGGEAMASIGALLVAGATVWGARCAFDDDEWAERSAPYARMLLPLLLDLARLFVVVLPLLLLCFGGTCASAGVAEFCGAGGRPSGGSAMLT